MVYHHIEMICAIIQRLFGQNKLITRFDGHRWYTDDYVHRLGLGEIFIVIRKSGNGPRRWPVHVRCRRKKLTFAISSPDDEFLVMADIVSNVLSDVVVALRSLSTTTELLISLGLLLLLILETSAQ